MGLIMVQLKKNPDINAFITSPPADVTAVLLYGPDAGLIKERADTIVKSVAEGSDDPFTIVSLDNETITETPARLFEESNAISMFGGRRVIRVNGASDKIAKTAENIVSDDKNQNLVVFVAGDLSPKSKLRSLFDKSKTQKSIACYQDNERDIANILNKRLQEDSIRIDNDARGWVLSHLGSDRANSRSEIEKLCLYAGQNGHIDLDMATRLVGDNQALDLSEMVFAAFDGNHNQIEHHFSQLVAEGVSPVAMLRTISNHIMKLQLILTTASQDNKSPSTVINDLRPPVFWKLKPRMENHVRTWNQGKLSRILSECIQTEKQSKLTGRPVDIMVNRLLHQISAMAKIR